MDLRFARVKNGIKHWLCFLIDVTGINMLLLATAKLQ